MRGNVKQAWQACQLDNLQELQELVPSSVSPDASTFDPTNHVHTLLMSAAAHGAVSCCKYLIEQEADVSKKNFSGYTALHWAAYTGRDECLKILLGIDSEEGKSSKKENNDNLSILLESQTEDGKTPLHIAAFRGNLDFIEQLVSYGADLNAVASNGWTALHYAITSNQKKVCEYLLSNNIKAQTPDSQGKTVFDIALQFERTWFPELAEQHGFKVK